MRVRKVVRIVFTLLSAPLLVVLYLNIETYAQSKGWDVILRDSLAGRMPNLLAFALQPWLALMGFGVISFTLGLWVDAVLRRFDSKRPTKAQKMSQLGIRCINASRHAKRIAGNTWLYGRDTPDLISEYSAIAIDLNKLGIPFIRVDNEANLEQNLYNLQHYLVAIGTLLGNGHLEAAKLQAQHFAEQTNQSE